MKKKEQIIGWLLCTTVFIIYAVCSSHTISFWDSAEFISSNYKLQVTHPPGSPLYMLICNVIMGVFPHISIAFLSNILSSFFGAVTVMIIYFITIIITKSLVSETKIHTPVLLPIISGIISGFTLAFIHSFWISSTETEVYTLSFLLLVLTWYIGLLWLKTENKRRELQLFLLIGLLLGLSTCVHLINLSIVIPLSILLVKKRHSLTFKNILVGLGSGVFIFLFIYGFVIQGFLRVALKLDIFLVNELRLKINIGLIILYSFLLSLLAFLLWITIQKRKPKLLLFSGFLLFFYIGISPYGTSMIRANAKTPLSNNPINSLELLKYITAEQFGISNTPLVKGYSFNAPLDKNRPFSNQTPKLYYSTKEKKYITVDDGIYIKENYPREFITFFPRMYSRKEADISGYNTWTTIKGTPIEYPINGTLQQINKPTFTENLSFFYNYQVNWLYLRYLFWNFIGKQNDNKGTGTILNGNWISGFAFIDAPRVGENSIIPDYYKNDLSKDTYYFLPLLFALTGLFFLRKSPVNFFTSLLFFFTFGLGITLYVNPTPTSILIRERDYIFVGSFIPLCIWIGLSTIQLYTWLSIVSKTKIIVVISSLIIFFSVPFQLFIKGWDDHNRSNDTFARDFAKGYLDSCPPNTILITNGDNMTFPLWYLQEVENYRSDVRVINFDQLTLNWYIEKLKTTVNTSKKLTISILKELYHKGPQQLLPLQQETDKPVDLDILFNFLSEPSTKKEWNGKATHYIPANIFSVSIDTLTIPKPYNTDKLNLKLVDTIQWNFHKNFYAVNDIVLLNIIKENINNRPIAFAINGNQNHYLGLQSQTIQRGMVELLAPIKRSKPGLNPKIVDTSIELPHFKGFEDSKVFIDYENRAYAQQILRRNYYFQAQALLEEDKKLEALQILDKSIKTFPNQTVPFKQFAFAMGKLYFRANDLEKGKITCLTAMQNLREELLWLISFNPPNPIINVRYANRLKSMYLQMIDQYSRFQPDKAHQLKEEFTSIEISFQKWHKLNWPY
ncbi:glycosyltransferase family 117 protein [Tenacibaculum agarivorans]|uniref:glycosyltransferase family 117 protein n=1 Tax=Tenacibaculum agarivorans TaxID=1908389 RepID=UPI0013563241|nr:DUF2723 domain-containing protein [Tenacibaculum agarivorans]